MGPPWGTWGPYLGIPSVEYFPNVFFWTSWTPWASPYLQMQWRPPKNLKNFQGAVKNASFWQMGLDSLFWNWCCVITMTHLVFHPHLYFPGWDRGGLVSGTRWPSWPTTPTPTRSTTPTSTSGNRRFGCVGYGSEWNKEKKFILNMNQKIQRSLFHTNGTCELYNNWASEI